MYSIAVAFTCLVSFLVGVVWSVRDTGLRIRIRPAAILTALAACGGLFLSGCAPAPVPADQQPALRASTIAGPLTTQFPPITLPPTTDPTTISFAPAAELPAATDPATRAPAPDPAQPACSGATYVNVDGNCVHDPVQAPVAPPGATARCGDGTYSFSRHHRGTCSHHGGVSAWL